MLPAKAVIDDISLKIRSAAYSPNKVNGFSRFAQTGGRKIVNLRSGRCIEPQQNQRRSFCQCSGTNDDVIMNLKGNTVLITGGTSGIGLAFAESFLKEGNTVLICGRREDRLKALQEKYPQLQTTVCDVSKAEDREALATWAIKKFPDL